MLNSQLVWLGAFTNASCIAYKLLGNASATIGDATCSATSLSQATLCFSTALATNSITAYEARSNIVIVMLIENSMAGIHVILSARQF